MALTYPYLRAMREVGYRRLNHLNIFKRVYVHADISKKSGVEGNFK